MTKPIDVDQMRQLLWTIADSRRVPESPAPKPQAIDLSLLDDILGSLGPDQMSPLLQLVQSELAKRPRVIRQCAERKDFSQLRREAHSFNGAVASFGLVGVALAAKAIELAAPGAELELALARLEGEANGASIALAPLICGLPVDLAANG